MVMFSLVTVSDTPCVPTGDTHSHNGNHVWRTSRVALSSTIVILHAVNPGCVSAWVELPPTHKQRGVGESFHLVSNSPRKRRRCCRRSCRSPNEKVTVVVMIRVWHSGSGLTNGFLQQQQQQHHQHADTRKSPVRMIPTKDADKFSKNCLCFWEDVDG